MFVEQTNDLCECYRKSETGSWTPTCWFQTGRVPKIPVTWTSTLSPTNSIIPMIMDPTSRIWEMWRSTLSQSYTSWSILTYHGDFYVFLSGYYIWLHVILRPVTSWCIANASWRISDKSKCGIHIKYISIQCTVLGSDSLPWCFLCNNQQHQTNASSTTVICIADKSNHDIIFTYECYQQRGPAQRDDWPYWRKRWWQWWWWWRRV